MKIVYAVVGIISLLLIINGNWNYFYSLIVLFGAFLAIRYAGNFSGFLTIIFRIAVMGLSTCLLIIFGVRGCIAADQEKYDELNKKYPNACDCLKGLEKNEIKFNDVINSGGKFYHEHPCSEALGKVYSDEFNDSLTPTKKDTVMALKNLYNCD